MDRITVTFLLVACVIVYTAVISSWPTPSMAQAQYQGQITNRTINSSIETTPPVVILSHTYWYDNSMRVIGPVLHIIGEVLNQSPSIVSNVKVVATLYDSNNKIVGTGWSYLAISNNLYPDDKSPFEIIIDYTETPNMEAISSYALAVDWNQLSRR